MAIVVSMPNVKQPITCDVCGCVYNLECNDKLVPIYKYNERFTNGDLHGEVGCMSFNCPCCGASNVLTLIKGGK